MKLRLAAPSVLIDIGRLADLSYIRDAGDHVAIGGLTRHRDLETSDLLGTEVPLLRHAAGQVGDPQVRHRGTIGGSIAHGDPASDLPAVLLALRATLVARGPSGERTIAVDDFFTGFLETALEPDRAAHRDPGAEGAGRRLVVPEAQPPRPGLGHRRRRLPGRRPRRRHRPGQHGRRSRCAPSAAEAALAGGASAADAAAVADEGTEPSADLNASADFRRHLARVLVAPSPRQKPPPPDLAHRPP